MDNKKQIVKQSKLGGFANFLTVLALLGLIYCIFATFSVFLFIIYTLIVVIVALLTFFTVNYTDSINSMHDTFKGWFATVPNVLVAVFALSCIALLIVLIKKEYKNFPKAKSSLILNIVIVVIGILILAIHIFKVVGY